MKPGSTVYLRLPNDTRLDPLTIATVTGCRPERLELSMATRDLRDAPTPAQGLEVLLFHEDEGGHAFLQQAARIETVGSRENAGPIFVEIELTSDAMAAEKRQHMRFPALNTGATVRIGERKCPVRDVSVMGLAIVAPDDFAEGEVLAVELAHGGDRYRGRLRVQNVRRLRPGQVRYGLRRLDDEPGDEPLRDGLRALATRAERIAGVSTRR